MAPPTRCLVWGAGAIGGTMGAYLARAGHDVTLVDIVAEHVAAISRSGLRISGPIEAFTTPLPAFTPDALRGEWETIILATKAQHTAAAVRALLTRAAARGEVPAALAEFPQLIAAPGLIAIIWSGLFERFEPLDVRKMMKTYVELLFAPRRAV